MGAFLKKGGSENKKNLSLYWKCYSEFFCRPSIFFFQIFEKISYFSNYGPLLSFLKGWGLPAVSPLIRPGGPFPITPTPSCAPAYCLSSPWKKCKTLLSPQDIFLIVRPWSNLLKRVTYRVSHETKQLVKFRIFFPLFINSCLIPKILKIWESFYVKIDFKVKYNWSKDLLN